MSSERLACLEGPRRMFIGSSNQDSKVSEVGDEFPRNRPVNVTR